MARAEASSEVSLWLTDCKLSLEQRAEDGERRDWPARRLVALVGRTAAGHVDFYVRPDGKGLSVSGITVFPRYRRRGLGSLLMDAVYAAFPDAWVDHGVRSADGVWWWDGYADPSPERNIHNRPPGDWARYFDAVRVGRDKTRNAYWNREHGVHGHSDSEYRYGERLEREMLDHAAEFHQIAPDKADPASEELHAGMVVILPRSVHRYVHDSSQSTSSRAQVLLEHIGHGNLPRRSLTAGSAGFWNTARRAAFEDAFHAEVFQEAPSRHPATHLVFRALPLSVDDLPDHSAGPGHVDYTGLADIPIDLAGISWRTAAQPWVTHGIDFARPVACAIPPDDPWRASQEYLERYDEVGFLRPGIDTAEAEAEAYADRADAIRLVAEKITRDSAARTTTLPARASGHAHGNKTQPQQAGQDPSDRRSAPPHP